MVQVPGHQGTEPAADSRTHGLATTLGVVEIKYGGSKRERVDDGRRWWQRKRGAFRMRTLGNRGVEERMTVPRKLRKLSQLP